MQLSSFLEHTLYAVLIQDESGDVYTLSFNEDPNPQLVIKYQNRLTLTGNLFTTVTGAESCIASFLALTEEQRKQLLATYWDPLYGTLDVGQEHEKLDKSTLCIAAYRTAPVIIAAYKPTESKS